MSQDLQLYLDNIKKPWGILFYRVVFEQLPKFKGAKILDFGSGFGLTANHLAKNNDVIAIEPNAEMVTMRVTDHDYHQMIGDMTQLKQFPDESFDLIICHNVLEYASDRQAIVQEFYRLLKSNGVLSIVKHNHAGRIMQKVVFENNVDEALSLLSGGSIEVMNFGAVHYYEMSELLDWIKPHHLFIQKTLGVRTFWGLQQNNDIKTDSIWQDKMFEIEMKVCELEEYTNISFFNHILLQKGLAK